ncbi:Z1 domain-containing protein [Micrococcaceae bacterium Sec6.3]
MNDKYTEAIVRALRAMEGYAPTPLLEEVNHHLRRTGQSLTEEELVEMATASDPNDKARLQFHVQLSRWDASDDEDWTKGTLPHGEQRRALTLSLLGLGKDSENTIDAAYPLDLGAVVIAKAAEWDPWYTDEVAAERAFYWTAYRKVLEGKIGGEATNELDRVTHEVVRRLADPTRKESYQSKGLVVGHVQSGKTANFTGVVAKAVDAGYRLVIVLTGTIELLRGQTQRRIDMELVGEENILGGHDKHNLEQVKDVDYAGAGDKDWIAGKFVRHGKHPKDLGRPGIRRLTDASGDYKSLKNPLGYLDFRATDHLVNPQLPLYDASNLFGTDIRLAVVKKERNALQNLIKDLKATRVKLAEIPTLIIDDEADQASINTKDNRKKSKEDRERTTINKLIAELLHELPRSQYIAYTATPFANVFVDPDDVDDIFPKDFIVSLEPPMAYMGGKAFHDLDRDPDGLDEADVSAPENSLVLSNERAYIRDLTADLDNDQQKRRDELRAALDSFVLSGALKLHRRSVGHPGDYRHHTMLVHESVRQQDHKELADTVEDVWKSAGYSTPEGMRRLHQLYKDDFAPVTAARAPQAPTPADFKELLPFIGEAVTRINGGTRPVIIVNGAAEKDYTQPDLDFQADDVWKVLVGGAKLSRGFTVEGLTTTYYTRRTTAADTLMQMGRWFGYRPGYGDLVRLYIGRNVPGPRKGSTVDLYKAFEAVVRDEEDFREQLRQYRGLDEDGRPRVRPIDVPPLVFQSLPWLTPTGRNKMFNAELTRKGEGGKVRDFFQHPRRDPDINERHFHAVSPLLDAAVSRGTFFTINPPKPTASATDRVSRWSGRYGIVDTETMLQILARFSWGKNFSFEPTLDFIQHAMAEKTLQDWAVIVPDLAGPGKTSVATRYVDGRKIDVLRRTRREERDDMFSGSSPRQRLALEIISGGATAPTHPRRNQVKELLETERDFSFMKDGLISDAGTRGALLLTFAADDGAGTEPMDLPDEVPAGDIASLFSLAMPYRSAPSGRIAFTAKVKGDDGKATYEKGEEDTGV